jgi:hypothetical protein
MFKIMQHDERETGDTSTYYPTEYTGYDSQQSNPELQEERKKQLDLYDHLDNQWLVYVEVGFSLSALLSSCSVVCLMRVFGASALAFGLSITAVICAAILVGLFWGEINRSIYKLRICVGLFMMGIGLSVALSDAAVDLTRHYWKAIAGASISFAACSGAVLVLIVANKALEINAKNHSTGNKYYE